MDAIVRYIKKLIIRTVLYPFRVLPVKHKRIVLVEELSGRYYGNPKYVAEYMNLHYRNKFEILYAVKRLDSTSEIVNDSVRFIVSNSLSYFYYCMTAKVILTNSGGISYLPLRKSQYVINTWHGGGAYKMAGIHMYNNSWFFRKDLELSSKSTAAFLSTNRRFTECISDSMLVDKSKFWEIGMPRNDILLNDCGSDIRTMVRSKLGLEPDEKLVLFAPTYRKANDDYFNDSIAATPYLDAIGICEALEMRFGGKWRFAIKLHPCAVNREAFVTADMLDLTDYSDMQELLVVADAMINDFSSSLWDYMLTGKPCFMYAEDMDHYIQTTRVYTPIEEWPFHKSRNHSELINSILSFDFDAYSEDCRRHYSELGGCETGKARALVCDRIAKICSSKRKFEDERRTQ